PSAFPLPSPPASYGSAAARVRSRSPGPWWSAVMASAAMMLEWKAEGRAGGMAEGMAMGVVEARRGGLVKLFGVEYHDLPPELNGAVRGAAELNLLTAWYDAALAAPTLEAFAILVRNR